MGRLQHVATMTPVLESRKIPHASRVTRPHFIRHFRSKRASAGVERHYAAKHRMPPSWSHIMGNRTWAARTEQACRRSIAAWQWFLEGYPQAKTLAATQGRPAPGLEDSLLSGLLGTHRVVKNTRTGVVSASLGHATYAVLLYPIQVLHEDPAGLKTMRLQGRPAALRFDYVVDAADWEILPHRPMRGAEHGMVLEQTAPAEPLVQSALREKPLPSFRTLQRLAQHLGVLPGHQSSTREVLRCIAEKVEPGNEVFLQDILQNAEQGSTNPHSSLLQDPLFEAAYDELPPEDQEEFPELKKAKVKRRVCNHMAGAALEGRKRKCAARSGPGLTAGSRRKKPRRVGDPAAGAAPAPAAAAAAAASAAGPAPAPAATAAAAASAAGPPAPAALEIQAAAAEAVEHPARENRAGVDGWDRLYHPSRNAFVRLSCNPDGSWDLRGTCARCTGPPATFTRTCRGPPATARAGTRQFGQGRPFGKVWLWVEAACALAENHTADAHPARTWNPEFAERRDARLRGSALPRAAGLLRLERPAHPDKDGDAGEPRLIP